MSPKNRWFRRPWIAAIIFVMVAGFTVLISGQQGGQMANPTNSLQVPILSHGPQEGPEDIHGLPDDWTHHHLVFSNPGTEEEAIQNGTHERWLKVVNDPRYILQQLRRRAPAQGPYAEYVDRMNEMARSQETAGGEDLSEDQLQDSLGLVKDSIPSSGRPKGIHHDWSTAMDGAAAVGTGAVGTLSSTSISGSSSITIGSSTTLTASAPTAASQPGTFSSPPTSSNNAISVKVGSNTLNLSTNATAASSTGTFSGPALGTTSISFTSGGNTLTMTPAGTGAQYVGTFAGPALTSTSIGITSGSNTLTMTPAGTAAHATGTFTAAAAAGNTVTITSVLNTLVLTPSGLGTVSFSGEPSSGDTITVGSIQYVWHSSSGCSSVNYCIVRSGTASTDASNLANAIGGSCGGNSCAANGSATASHSSSVTTITNTTAGGINFSLSSSAYTLSPTSGTILASTNSGCPTSSSVGSYVVGVSASAQASDLAAAINNCNSSFASVGATASYSSGTSFTITDSYPGSSGNGFAFTLAESSSGFSWGTVTAGTAGSASCSGTAPTFTGNFVNNTNTTTVAGNLNSAMTCAASVGFSTGTSTNTVTVTDLYPGAGINTFTVSGSVTGVFTWGNEIAGTNGSAGCSGTAPTFTGTYVNSGTPSTLAGNFNTAITGSGCSAVGFTTSPSGATVTVTDTILGAATFNASNNTNIFSWSAGSAGAIGSYTCAGSASPFTATYATATSTTTLATNLSSAITNCNGSTLGVSSSSSLNTVTLADTTPGTGGNSGTTLTPTAAGPFAWSAGSLAGGTDGTTSGMTFAYWSVNSYVTPSVLASNVATAINDNTTLEGTAGVMANPSNNVVTLTARTNGTSGNSIALSKSSFSGLTWSGSDLSGGASGNGKVQPNAYPAKYGVSLTGASCSDFVVYPTGQAGATGVASIIAYYNLYSTGCAGAVPSVDWAYNTGGTVTTSPILSSDGSQVAFIQVSGTAASLVLLKWAPGPMATLTSQSSGSAYRSCTAPCMYTLAFANGKDDTFSSPFYDYAHDLLYVGDDSGYLHQFSGVFGGAPAESGSPWPVNLGTNKLSSPVYDSDQGFEGGYVFVGDFGGVFYGVGTGYGGTTNGQVHGNTGSLGDAIADAPLVDSSEGTEYVFVTTNGSTRPYNGDNAVWEFVSSFTGYGSPGVVYLGTGGSGYYLYAGDFDNVYYESGNPAYGHLYVVGNTGTAGGGTLYQVEIAYSSLVSSTAVASGLNSAEHPWPSPLIEFCNNGTSACPITSQRSVTAKVSTTSPEITILNGSGTFSNTDVGAVVTGTDIPWGATISSVLNSTTANLSSAPTAAVSSESLAIQGGQTTAGTDYVFFSVNRGTPSGCTNAAGDGCVLAYNVTKPTSVSQAGSGLNVTTPGSSGCWATGGFVIDNSDQSTTGAQQIYFMNLNGASAGGPAGATSSNCTSGTATLNATQAAQSSP